jgi:hypothetical protein
VCSHDAKAPHRCSLDWTLKTATASKLGIYRPNTHELAQFREPGWLWMALVLMRFTAPSDGESYDEKHYVLVAGCLPDEAAFVVADPHPWNPPVYCVHEHEFDAAWRSVRTKGPPWAAALYRRGGDR